MATWLMHFRVAEELLKKIENLDNTAFVIGSVAPDSGVPNEDYSEFNPPKKICHFWKNGYASGPDSFYAEYFTKEKRLNYNITEYSFYLGFLTHLITDVCWGRDIYDEGVKKALESDPNAERKPVIKEMKQDFYYLDNIYAKEHTNYSILNIYENAAGWNKVQMKEFPENAFANRMGAIAQYCHGPYCEENHICKYVDAKRLNLFVTEAANECITWLKDREIGN